MEFAAVTAVLAALGGILKLFFDFLNRLEDRREKRDAERDASFQKALEDHRHETQAFLGNHMSGNTRALEALVTVVEDIAERCFGEDENGVGGPT